MSMRFWPAIAALVLLALVIHLRFANDAPDAARPSASVAVPLASPAARTTPEQLAQLHGDQLNDLLLELVSDYTDAAVLFYQLERHLNARRATLPSGSLQDLVNSLSVINNIRMQMASPDLNEEKVRSLIPLAQAATATAQQYVVSAVRLGLPPGSTVTFLRGETILRTPCDSPATGNLCPFDIMAPIAPAP